jgi:probable blue pigment (indigoidine) exporter
MFNHVSHRYVLFLIGAAACWGGGTVVTKQVLDTGVSALALLPVQLAASCAFLTAVLVLRGERLSWSPQTRRLGGLGVLNPGLAYALGLVGLTSISASMSVLLWAAEPVLIVLFAMLLLQEGVPAARAVALGTAVGGVLLVVYQPGASGETVGVALTLAAVAACAVYAVLTRMLLLDDGTVPVVLAQQAAALVFAVTLAAGWAGLGHDLSFGPSSASVWLAAGVSGALYYGLAFWLFVSGLREVPASLAGAFLPLVPVFGVAAGYLVGERLSGRQWMGAALVATATAVAAVHEARGQRPRCSTPETL